MKRQREPMKRGVKHSIKKQFAGIFIGLMAGTILLCWFINSTLLESYYIQNKQKALQSAYERINAASTDGNLTSEKFDIELQKICGRYNISMVVMDADAQAVKASSNDYKMLTKQLLDNLFSSFGPGAVMDEEKKERTQEEELGLYHGEDGPGFFQGLWQESAVIEQAENYVVKNAMDPRTQTEYLEMWGVLDNGNLFLLRTPKEGIRDSVRIANRFLAYVGIFAAVASGIIIWFVSRKITEPILELADISARMTDLDFEVKYTGSGHNEIAMLGEHINQLSEALERTISELKTANNELTSDLARKTEMDEMRKEFLSNVSHELKTPIALIQGYAEGLREGINEDEESRNFYCDVIMDEAAKMNTMVKKLMTLNQLESGNDVVSMERFNVTELIRSCVQSGELLAKQNGIIVRMEETPDIYVWADEFKTEEVFINYFSNAVNHCLGEKTIHVKLTAQDQKVRISVFNTGMPIPEECIPHLWEKFYKVDKARTREYGGSGVGLSIVKAIMDSMNQHFGVCNYENGVEFWFELETS
mgnify:CR=1 FL=1